ncbi:caspase family protein [Kitasatospora sp. cg17-2]
MRYLIAAGTRHYPRHPGLAELPQAHEDVDRIVQFLTSAEMGYSRVLEAHSEDPTAADFEDALSSWCLEAELTADDVITVYYAGHGDEPTPGGRYRLACTDSREGHARSWLSLDNLTEALAASPVRHVLFIIDACHAEVGAAEIGTVANGIVAARPRSDAYGSGTWVLASARHRDVAMDGAFVTRLVAACERGDGPSQRFLSPATVTDRVNRVFMADGYRQRAACSSTDQAEQPPFFANPGFDPSAEIVPDGPPSREASDLSSHFEPRGRGVEQVYDSGSYFTGRGRALTTLRDHLASTGDHGVMAVTAAPGSGKSAVLGRVVLDGHSDVSINARHQVLGDLVGRLAAASDLRVSDPTALLKALAGRSRPLRIVIDSLDEAGSADDKMEARHIAWELLRPLAAVPCVRLVVGTRRELVPYIGDQVPVIDLDSPEYAADTSTVEYVERILTDQGSPYQGNSGSARAIAEEVARRAGHCFLVARMVASALLRAEPMDTSVPGWAESLPSDVGGAFEEYLRRLPNDRREASTWLLTALAFGEGHGLPRKVWLPVARRLSGLPLREADIDRLLEENGSYLLIVEIAGAKHFRLYHQELTDHLRQRVLRHWDLRDVAERFVNALLDLTPNRAWSRAYPYVRSQLATHAAAAGMIERFVADPSFILAAEPAGLLRAVRHVKSSPKLAMVVERFVDVKDDAALQQIDQAARLAFVAESHGTPELARRAEELSSSIRRVRIESRPVTPHRIVGRHEDLSYSTTSFDGGWLVQDAKLPSGDRLALAFRRTERVGKSARSSNVHLWALDDPANSTVLPHSATVVDMAVLRANQGNPLAVTLDDAGDLRVWDLADHTLVRHLPRTRYQAILNTGKLTDGTPVVVCRDERRVVVHDPLAEPMFEVDYVAPTNLTVERGVTARLVHLGFDEPALIVCDGVRGTVTRWMLDGTYSVLLKGLDKPTLLGETLQGEDAATAVVWEGDYSREQPRRLFLLDCDSGKATVSQHDPHDWPRGGFVSLGGSDNLYVTAAHWGKIQIQSTITGYSDTVKPKVRTDFFIPFSTSLHGRILAVVGELVGGIQILDCGTGSPASTPMVGHEGAIQAIHLLGSAESGSADVLTVGNDGTARLWHWTYTEETWHPNQKSSESEEHSSFARAHTQSIHGWRARPDVVVASSWGDLRLLDATVLDCAGTERQKISARTLLSVHNALETWVEDPDGAVHYLVKSEEIVDTASESLTKASFIWHRITTAATVDRAELSDLTMVPWDVDCHLLPASALHSHARVVGYCPLNGRLHAVASYGAKTETTPSWWPVDPEGEMVYSTAFTAHTGHAILMVAVRQAAIRGDHTISNHFITNDQPGKDSPSRGFLWDATTRQPLRHAPLELPAQLTALAPHHATKGTRYVAMACRNGQAAVLDLDTERTRAIHLPHSDRSERRLSTHRELADGHSHFLRWVDTSGDSPVLLYMDAAETDDSTILPVTIWDSAAPDAHHRTLAVRARRLLWTGPSPNGQALVAVSDEHGVALCHLPSGERVWATPTPAFVTSLTALPGSQTLDLAVGTQQGVVLLRPRLSAAWEQRLGVRSVGTAG